MDTDLNGEVSGQKLEKLVSIDEGIYGIRSSGKDKQCSEKVYEDSIDNRIKAKGVFDGESRLA